VETSDLFMPLDHAQDDLLLAARVARTFELEALWVTWSLEGRYFDFEEPGPGPTPLD
jgi:hypothetical protein